MDRLMVELLDMCIHALEVGITLGTDGLFYSKYMYDGYYIEQDPVFPECDSWHDETYVRGKLYAYYIGNAHAMEMDREWLERALECHNIA